MPKFTIDMLKISRHYASVEIEAPNLDAAKRIALDRADGADDEDFWGSADEVDLTAWAAGADIIDGDDLNRMRIGDAAYEAGGGGIVAPPGAGPAGEPS